MTKKSDRPKKPSSAGQRRESRVSKSKDRKTTSKTPEAESSTHAAGGSPKPPGTRPKRQTAQKSAKAGGRGGPPRKPAKTSAARSKPTAGHTTPAAAKDIYQFADQLEASSKRRAAETQVEEPEDTWVTFEIGSETFGLPVETVTEVMRVPDITRVPHAPAAVRGVTNRRGRVLPIIDLSRRLRLPESALLESSRIVVVNEQGRSIGLLVDSVRQLESIRRSAVQPPPDDVMTEQSHYLTGVSHLNDRLLVLLDLARVLEAEPEPHAAA